MDGAPAKISPLPQPGTLPFPVGPAVFTQINPLNFTMPFGGANSLAQVINIATNRSEEHTSELQSQSNLVCRLLLEKKKDLLQALHLGPRLLVLRARLIHCTHR